MRPALNAGGDWYDAFDLDNKTFIIVADVCDKGVGALVYVSFSVSYVIQRRIGALNHQKLNR